MLVIIDVVLVVGVVGVQHASSGDFAYPLQQKSEQLQETFVENAFLFFLNKAYFFTM